jgi:hypothetical protein
MGEISHRLRRFVKRVYPLVDAFMLALFWLAVLILIVFSFRANDQEAILYLAAAAVLLSLFNLYHDD